MSKIDHIPGVIWGSEDGWRIHGYIIGYAASMGFPITDKDRERTRTILQNPIQPYEEDYDYYDLSDEAERWLNEHIAPDGMQFGWRGGEFFIQTDEWWNDLHDPDSAA